MSPLLQSPLTNEYALLGFARHEPVHGYEIYRRLTETPELLLVWRMKQSRLYAWLSRLEDDGLLQATFEPQDGRPPRKVFHMTPQGEKAFGRWLVEPVKLPREMRLEFMLKLFFAVGEGDETVARLVRKQQETCGQWLAEWGEIDASLSTFARAVRLYRRKHIETIHEWLASLAAEYSSQDPVFP